MPELPASVMDNVWFATCKQCGASDIVGPGHPACALTPEPYGLQGFANRDKLRFEHGSQCQPNFDTGTRPIDLSFMATPMAMRKANFGIVSTSLMMLKAFAIYRLAMAAAGMTDQTLVDTLLSNLLHASTTATWTPGTGGTSLTITPPILLRLFSTTGSETTTGTQCTTGNSPGYTSGGITMGTNAFGAFSSGAATNTNQVQYTATGTWTAGVTAIECFDSSGTAVRILWGALGTAIIANAVTNTDTITFAAASISASGATW